MSSLFKLVNIGGKTVEIRMVKKANTSAHFAGNVKPAGSVDNETELSFKLGGNTGAPYEHIVIAHAGTPNIVNPAAYVTNGNEYRLEQAVGQSVMTLTADLEISVQDPNYAQKQLGIFFRVKAEEVDYIMSTPTGSFNVRNNLNDSVKTITDLRATRGVYFTDNDYYLPLYLGTPKDILGVWGAQEYGVDPVYGNRVSHVLNEVQLVRFVPVQTVTITNSSLTANKGSTVDIITALTPLDATIKQIQYSTDNVNRGIFKDPIKPTLTYTGIGDFTVSVRAIDMLGNQVTTSRAALGLINVTPFTVRLSPTAENPEVALNVNGVDGTVSYVDWGDGNVTALSETGAKYYSHTYAIPGSYAVKVYTDGVVSAISFPSNSSYQELLTEVVSWGDGVIEGFDLGEPQFLTTVPTNAPPHVTRFDNFFKGAISFNGDITAWDMSKAVSLAHMFHGASAFNRNISGWDVSKVIFFNDMFRDATAFNQPIGSWNLASAVTITGMFENARSFNQPLNAWNVSSVENMSRLFNYALTFNQDLNSWNTANVTDMQAMFRATPVFNGNITTWDTSKVTNMSSMFASDGSVLAAFNRDISKWNVSNVTNMNLMFMGTSYFNQDLRWWCVSKITKAPTTFATNTFATDNRPRWGMCPVREAVASIEGAAGPFIVGQAIALTAKVTPTMPIQSTVWTSSNPSTVAIDQNTGEAFMSGVGEAIISVTINGLYTATRSISSIDALTPLTLKTTGVITERNLDVALDIPSSLTVRINWGDGTEETANQTVTHKYATTGSKIITVSPLNNADIPAMGVYGEIEEVVSWYGGITSQISFGDPASETGVGETKLIKVPTTIPNGLTNMVRMFANCVNFNQDLSLWNTSAVTDMTRMFYNAPSFNQPLASWDTSSVTTMRHMFEGASTFNQDISGWDVSVVSDMHYMFRYANNFNQDLTLWCVASIDGGEPSFFATNSALAIENYPVWGTCPNRNLTTTIVADKTTVGLGLKTRLSYLTNPTIEVTDEKWVVEDPTILSVSTRGLITAKAIGSTTVHLTLNRTYKASIWMSVTELDFDAETMVLTVDSSGGNAFVTMANLSETESVLVDLGDGTTKELLAGEVLRHDYTEVGMNYVQVTPVSEPLNMTFTGTYDRVLQWSSVGYTSLRLSSEDINATRLTDVPSTEPVGLTSYEGMFEGATIFNDDLSLWNTSAITNMSRMFYGAKAFNGNIKTWDTSKVTNMSGMFASALAFNQDIGGWATGAVTNMNTMFYNASTFNQNISGWDVSKVTDMVLMFGNASAFSHDLSWWCVPNITEEPNAFRMNADLFTPEKQPVWGTCPNRNYILDLSPVDELMVGETEQLTYTLLPETEIVSIEWAVDDSEIATIDTDGRLVGVTPGVVVVSLAINKLYTTSANVVIVARQEIIAPTDLTATIVTI